MNWIEIILAVVFVVVSALAAAMAIVQRVETFCAEDARRGMVKGNAPLLGAIVGGLAGVCGGVLLVYYTLIADPAQGWMAWAGRGSYFLILVASAGHVNLLIHVWMRVLDEEEDVRGDSGGAQKLTLTVQRRSGLRQLRLAGAADLRGRDDEAIEDLISVIGDRLIVGQRALSRLPFYGYLGTVCGILVMANELTELNEATESFKVLRDMAGGLVLAFQTTLAALIAYLPLRKAFDVLFTRVAALERAWIAMREDI